MEHTPVMGGIDRLGHLRESRRRLAGRDLPGGEPLGERRAFDEPHAVEGMAAILPDFED